MLSSWMARVLRRRAGACPYPGCCRCTLSAADEISGTVPVGTPTGTYSFGAGMDSLGGEAVVSLEIQVVAAPAELQGHTHWEAAPPAMARREQGCSCWRWSGSSTTNSSTAQRGRGEEVFPNESAPKPRHAASLGGSCWPQWGYCSLRPGRACTTISGRWRRRRTPPPGISLVSNGTLIGEPQYDGTSNFKVSVTDSPGPPSPHRSTP